MVPGRLIAGATTAALLLAGCAVAGPTDEVGTPPGGATGGTEAVSPAGTAPDGTVVVGAAPGTTIVSSATSAPRPASVPASGAVVTAGNLVLPIRAEVVGGGWVVGTPCGGEAVVTRVAGLVAPLRVLLDPGHGGDETGAVSPYGTVEADVNLDVSRRVAGRLQAAGVAVALTRLGDDRVEITTRAELARQLDPEIMVSIHHNAGHAGPSTVPGTLAFHQLDAPSSTRLAGLLYEQVSRAIEPLDLDWVGGAAPGAMAVRNERGEDYYGVLRLAPEVPTVIVEGMFITGRDEGAALSRAEVRQLEADAIAEAILGYLTTTASGSGFRPAWEFDTTEVPGDEPPPCLEPELEPPA